MGEEGGRNVTKFARGPRVQDGAEINLFALFCPPFLGEDKISLRCGIAVLNFRLPSNRFCGERKSTLLVLPDFPPVQLRNPAINVLSLVVARFS